MYNNKQNIFISILFLVLAGYLLFKYQELRNENLILRLKVNMLAEKKKVGTPWNKTITFESKEKSKAKVQKVNSYTSNTQIDNADESIEEKSNFEKWDTDQLKNAIQFSLKSHWRLSKEEIEKNLSMVEELIARDPSLYSSYKAKLILILTKDHAHHGAVDEREIEELLTIMSEFDVVTNKALKKEAFLIAKSNESIDTALLKIEELENELDQADGEDSIQELERELLNYLDHVEVAEAELEDYFMDHANYLNEDVVEIPFLRLLARAKYDQALEEAESLLNEFPSSLSGHFFLIKSLELAGRKEEALDYIQDLDLGQAQIELLQKRLSQSKKRNPKNYWKRLRF